MSPKHRAELVQAKKAAFEDISFRVTFQALLITPNITARCDSVQLVVIAEEVVRVALNVPIPAHRKLL